MPIQLKAKDAGIFDASEVACLAAFSTSSNLNDRRQANKR